MRKIIALVCRDFREMKWFLLVLCVTIVISAIISSTAIQYHILCRPPHENGRRYIVLLFDYSHAIGIVMAVLLVYSFATAFFSSKAYFFFSLPVHRSHVLLSKVSVISISAFLIAFLAILTESLIQGIMWWTPVCEWLLASQKPDPLLRRMIHSHLSIFTPGWMMGTMRDYIYWARHILLLPGMVCFAQGVTAFTRRYRFGVWTITFFISLFIYAIVNGAVEKELLFVPLYKQPLWMYLFDLEAGLVFMIAGCLLYGWKAEV